MTLATRRGAAVLGGVGIAALGLVAALASGLVLASAASGATAGAAAAATAGCSPSDVTVVSRNAHLTSVTVKLSATSAVASCDVSLHSYETQGKTWATSGTQTPLGFDSAHLVAGVQVSLSVPEPACFGQTDLVVGTTRYDGVDGPLPKYPNGVFDSSVTIANWHGQATCVGGTSSPSPSPSVSPTSTSSGGPGATPTPTPTVTPTPSPTPSGSVLPTATSTAPGVQPETQPSPSPSVLGVTFQRPPAAPPAPGAVLPFTGAPITLELIAGVALVGTGLVVFGLHFRRRRVNES